MPRAEGQVTDEHGDRRIHNKSNTIPPRTENTFIQNTVEFDSLESKLKGIFLQLNTLKSQHE